jgi:hypothetical protein
MKPFWTGLYTYFSAVDGSGTHNSFYTSIGGRMFNGRAPDGVEFPYCVFTLISAVPTYTWGFTIENLSIDFDIFSSTNSTTEIEDIATNLRALFDDCYFTVATNPMVSMVRQSFNGPYAESYVTTEGTQVIWHTSINYEVLVDPIKE